MAGKCGTIRVKKTKEWKGYLKDNQNRGPTRNEGLAFGNGFNSGWKAHMKIASKYLYGQLSELVNNLEDDLQLDLKEGEDGYKNYQESYKAVKKYTLKILKKKLKAAEHNFKLGKETKNDAEQKGDEQ